MPRLLRLVRRSTRHYLLAAGVVTVACWRCRPVRRVKIGGDSMRPALEPGDRLLLLAVRRLRVGDMVAFPDPRTPARTVVKRIAATGPAGLTVLGDNAGASTDSRTWGPVAPAVVTGRAVYRYFPDSRRGLL